MVIVKDWVFRMLPFRHGGWNQRRGRSTERRRWARLPSLISDSPHCFFFFSLLSQNQSPRINKCNTFGAKYQNQWIIPRSDVVVGANPAQLCLQLESSFVLLSFGLIGWVWALPITMSWNDIPFAFGNGTTFIIIYPTFPSSPSFVLLKPNFSLSLSLQCYIKHMWMFVWTLKHFWKSEAHEE